VGSKYGQFALGRILENETPNSARHVTPPYNLQHALAAAQGLDEAQVHWGMALEFETVESGGGEDEARRLFLLAAAQGSHTPYSMLRDTSLDDQEENSWREREDSAENVSLYSAGAPPRSATLTTLVSVKARLNDLVAANQVLSAEMEYNK
jgi:hypothetical protein